jgi:hypothetical protein
LSEKRLLVSAGRSRGRAAAMLMSLGMLLFANVTFAQSYPSRPIKLIVPFPGARTCLRDASAC